MSRRSHASRPRLPCDHCGALTRRKNRYLDRPVACSPAHRRELLDRHAASEEGSAAPPDYIVEEDSPEPYGPDAMDLAFARRPLAKPAIECMTAVLKDDYTAALELVRVVAEGLEARVYRPDGAAPWHPDHAMYDACRAVRACFPDRAEAIISRLAEGRV